MLGLTAYLPNLDATEDDVQGFAPIFDFIARYVRKVHSDRHIKSTLLSSPGMSFLDMIGPSDIAYIITILKNSKEVWQHDTADKSAAIPKPLFTRGESKKRVFGNTTMNKDGQDYFKEGVKNWKTVFDRTCTGFLNLKTEWEQWLQDESSVVNTDTWRRKNIRSLLAVRVQRNQRREGDDQENGEESGAEGVNVIKWEYDSDGELGQALGREHGDSEEDDESIGMGHRRGGDRQSSGRTIEDEEDADDDDCHDKEEEEEQEPEEEEDNRKRNYSDDEEDNEEEMIRSQRRGHCQLFIILVRRTREHLEPRRNLQPKVTSAARSLQLPGRVPPGRRRRDLFVRRVTMGTGNTIR